MPLTGAVTRELDPPPPGNMFAVSNSSPLYEFADRVSLVRHWIDVLLAVTAGIPDDSCDVPTELFASSPPLIANGCTCDVPTAPLASSPCVIALFWMRDVPIELGCI